MKKSLALIAVFLAGSGAATAQVPRTATLLVTVTDQTGAVIPGATVTVEPVGVTPDTNPTHAQTSERGTVTIARLTPGRYRVGVEFPGFQAALLPDRRLQPGDNRQVVTLYLARLQDSVTVSQDPRAAAADRSVTFMLQASNLTNQRNFAEFIGTMTSPFFGKPSAVCSRRVTLGVNLTF